MHRTHFRWVVIALLFFITVTNYIDRASISYAIVPMAQLFHLNATQIGLIFGAFGLGYFVTTFLGGIAVDRYGVRIILAISTFFWSIAVGLTGLATGFLIAYCARSLLGLAEGPNFPATARIVGDWLPKHERARALSSALVAVPLALAIGGPIVTQLITHITWRGMFIVLGILGLVWLPLWWFFFRDFPENSRFVNQEELNYIREAKTSTTKFDAKANYLKRRNIKGLWKFLLTNPTLLVNNWAFFVYGYFLFFFMTWLPTYLQDQYHLNIKEIGWFSVLPWLLAAILLWCGGYLSDLILRKTDNFRLARSHLIWVSQLLAALSIIPIITTHNVYVAMVFISLAVAFNIGANSAFYATNIDVAADRAGSSLGLMNAGFAISGFIAPAMTGWLVNTTHSFTSAFILMAVLALSSVLLVIFWHHTDTTEKI